MEGMDSTLGVYSTQKMRVNRLGQDKIKKEMVKIHWFVKQLDEDYFEVQPLNKNHVPSGVVSVIPKAKFMGDFSPEPNYYREKTLPIMKKLDQEIRDGEDNYSLGNLDDAEQAFLRAMNLDDENVRATMGLGKVYSDQGDEKNVKAILEKLLTLEGTFQKNQRHQLNKFGIALRKNGMFEKAETFLSRALEIDPEDEHLHFNIARVYHAMNKQDRAKLHLQEALAISKGFTEAAKFLEYLEKQFGAV